MLLLLSSFLAFAASQSHEESLCSRWGNLYESMCPNQVERSVLISHQRIQGKRGPVGVKGEIGLKGSKGSKGAAGEANYDRVEELMSQKLEEVLRNQSRKFTELSDELMEAKTEIRLANKSEGYCPFKYNGSCFWVAPRISPEITFEQGRQICEAQGGKPANIYSEDHYSLMLGYLRTFQTKDGYMFAWLGMTYNAQTGSTLLYDGSNAPFVKWHPGYPNSDSGIGLQTHMNRESRSQHMHTFSPSYTRRGVICEN